MEVLKRLTENTEIACDYSEIESQFEDYYPDTDMDELEYVYHYLDTHDPRMTFRLYGELICCRFNEDDMWNTVEQFILASDENGNQRCKLIGAHGEEEDIFTPAMRGDKQVKYDLYPFEQGLELTLPELGFSKRRLTFLGEATYNENTSINDLLDSKNLDRFKFGFDNSNISFRIEDSEHGQSYLIFNGDKEIAGFDSYCYSYQFGDSETNVYLYDGGKSIIIENCGDVSSVVVNSNLNI